MNRVRQRGPLIFLGVLLAVLLPFAWKIGRLFVMPFLLSAIVATVMHPVRDRIQHYVKRRKLATLITTLGTVIVFGTILFFVGFALSRELADAYGALGRLSVQEGGWPNFLARSADRMIDIVASYLPVDKDEIRDSVAGYIDNFTGYFLRFAGAVATELTTGILTGLLVAIFLYFLLEHGPNWVNQMRELMPLSARTTESLLQTLRDAIFANVNGVLAVVIVQGLLLILGFWIAGLRSPVLWGAVGGLASIIPLVGSTVVWVPIVIGFALTGAYLKAFLLTVWCVAIVGAADNIIRPFVVGGRVQEHPVLIALAMIGGTEAFGGTGVLLGPVILSLLMAVVVEIRRILTDNPEQTEAPEETKSPAVP